MGSITLKTTIKCSGCVAKATPYLNEAAGEGTWKVDTENPSKILTVVGNADEAKVIQAVEKAGFKAERI